jgi:hypothetical protein
LNGLKTGTARFLQDNLLLFVYTFLAMTAASSSIIDLKHFNNVYFNSQTQCRVEVKRDEYGGWCLRTTQNIPKGTELLQVPDALTIKCGKQSHARLFKKAGGSERGALAAYLVLQKLRVTKGEHCEWIAMLPTETIGCLAFTEAQIASCWDEDLSEGYFEVLKEAKPDFAVLQQVVQASPGSFLLKEADVHLFSWELFVWAASIVRSRILMNRQEKVATLVPLLDFANHSPDEVKTAFEFVPGSESGSGSGSGATPGKGYWRIVSSHAMKAGDEVCICYGGVKNWQSNGQLLQHYKFVVRGSFSPLETTNIRISSSHVQALLLLHDSFAKMDSDEEAKDEVRGRKNALLARLMVQLPLTVSLPSATATLSQSSLGSNFWALARVVTMGFDQLEVKIPHPNRRKVVQK